MGIDLSARIVKDLWPCVLEVLEHSLSKKGAAARRGAARDVEKFVISSSTSTSTSTSTSFPSALLLAEVEVPGIRSALSPLLKGAKVAGAAVAVATVEAAARLFGSWCDGAEAAVLSSSASSAAEVAAPAAAVVAAAELLSTNGLPRALSGESKADAPAAAAASPSSSLAPLPCFAERLEKLKEALRPLLTKTATTETTTAAEEF